MLCLKKLIFFIQKLPYLADIVSREVMAKLTIF